jgi:hypothetical protein
MSHRVPALCRLLDLARLDAIRAYSNAPDRAVDLRPNGLKVGEESARHPVVGMTHVVSRHRLLAAYFTNSCHFSAPSRYEMSP